MSSLISKMLAVFLTLTTVFFSVFSISTRAAAPWDFDTETESVMTADEGENSASPETAPEGSTAAEPDDNTPSEEGGTENDTDDKEDLAGTGITAEHASEQEPEPQAQETDPQVKEPEGSLQEETGAAAAEMPAFTADITAGSIGIRIRAQEGVLPAGTKAEAYAMPQEQAAPYAEKAESMAGNGIAAAVIDIRFTDLEGKEIQPLGMVLVTFENAADENSEITVFHAVDSDIDKMEEVRSETKGSDVSIENDRFSPYILLTAGSEPDWTKGGTGTWRDVKYVAPLRLSLGDLYTYTLGESGLGSGMGATYKVVDQEQNEVGYGVCIVPGRSYDVSSAPDHIYECTFPMLVKAMYYGAWGPHSEVVQNIASSYGYGGNFGTLDLITHYAASKIYEEAGWSRISGTLDGKSNELRELVKAFVRDIEDRSVPSDYYAYVMAYDKWWAQDFCFAAGKLTPPTGEAFVKKTSTNSDATDENSLYSFEGARYWIYTSREDALARGDEGWVNGGSLLTGPDGSTEPFMLAEGDYYLIEGAAPEGFLLSDEVFPFTVSEGETTMVEAQDDPASVSDAVVIDKKCRGSAQERINSLAGTQFTVCYYKGLYDASSIPEEASAIWVIQALQTQEGTFRASLDEEHFVSGDSLYTVGGKAVLPLGTFTIRETKAADGYENDGRFADAEMYIGQIRLKEDGSGPEIIDLQGERSTANSFEVLDTPMTPRIGTRACDQATGTHTANTAGPVVIRDTVSYENLVVGEGYTLRGRMVDKKTGETLKDIHGSEVTAEAAFIADSMNGTTELLFRFEPDAALAGRSAVAFESVCLGDKEIAAHADLTDEEQTIHFLNIETDACDLDTGSKTVPALKDRVIVDKISYAGLDAGKTYVISGEIKSRSGSEKSFDDAKTVPAVIIGAKGEGEVTYDDKKVTFTPAGEEGETVSGELFVSFKVDASELAGQELVVGETLRYGDIDLAVHRDITDERQSVYIQKESKSYVGARTGDSSSPMVWIGIAAAAAAALAGAAFLQKRRS